MPDVATEEAASTGDSMDPTVSESDHYKVEFENDHVRAVRITYAAGEETGMHSHPASVSVFLTDGAGVLGLEDGTEQEIAFKAGDTIWMEAQSHQPRADTDFELIQIELKGKGQAAATSDSTDPTVSEPDHYKVQLENDDVRAVRITYAAGEETQRHSHPASVSVFLTDGAGVLGLEDGTEQEIAFEAGDTIWMDAQSHQPRSNTDFELIQLEFKGR